MLLTNPEKINNYSFPIYASVFCESTSRCGDRHNFCVAVSDVRSRSNRQKTLEPLRSWEFNGLFFHPGDKI